MQTPQSEPEFPQCSGTAESESVVPPDNLRGLASIDLNLLVSLCALLEERSVTRAAERVMLSQPAMSHALRRLRTFLGDELLIRHGGTMHLTPRAHALLPPVRLALVEAARVLTPTQFDARTDTRTVTIALTASTAFVFGPLLRRVFDREAPHMTLELRSGDVSEPTIFTANGVDVVLLTEGLVAPHSRERLYDDWWVVLASPDVPEYSNVSEMLTNEPHIRYESAHIQIRPYEALQRAGVHCNARQTVADYLLIPHFLRVIRGVGLHRFQVAAEFTLRDPLQLFDFPVPVPGLGIDMVWNPWLTDNAFQTWLRAALHEAAQPLRERALHNHPHTIAEGPSQVR